MSCSSRMGKVFPERVILLDWLQVLWLVVALLTIAPSRASLVRKRAAGYPLFTGLVLSYFGIYCYSNLGVAKR